MTIGREHTKQHLVRSFMFLDNEDHHKLAESFVLLKFIITKTPDMAKSNYDSKVLEEHED